MNTCCKSYLKIGVAALVLLVGVGGYIAWDRGFREHPQADWVMRDADTRFMYSSIGGERDAGIPYWIFYVLPRLFPEKLPGPGGYSSLGIPWQEGYELPVGFTKMTIGFPRVGNNCAVCHTMTYRIKEEAKPVFIPLGPGHTSNVEGFFRFVIDCAKDPRFNADNIMFQIAQVTKLDLIDTVLYRYIIIPITKKRLLEREHQFQWIYNKAYPDWGRGRDDAMNLTKYFMIKQEPPDDGTFGPTDFPAIWNLKKYDNPEGEKNPQRLNLAGDTWDAYSVVMDSALGILGAAPHRKQEFIDQVRWVTDYAKAAPIPRYPDEFPIDPAKAQAGKMVFDQHCAGCHAEGSPKVGRPLPLADIGTSRDRLDSWNKDAAIKANQIVRDMGIDRRGLVEEDLIGYNVPHLDGIWLRGPYLHNGSVPTLQDLLKPPGERPKLFYRGCDVYDPVNVGFKECPEGKRIDPPYDVSRKGNGNSGHVFGTELPASDKDALIEYMKTL